MSRKINYWKEKSIDKLRDYSFKKCALKNIRDEIMMLEDEAKSIKSSNIDAGSSKSNVTAEDRLLSNIAKREELRRSFSRTKHDCLIVERGLDALNANDRDALYIMYIEGGGKGKHRIEKVLTAWGITDERTAYRRLDDILRNFAISIYGPIEL